jgi:hypothetical protein
MSIVKWPTSAKQWNADRLTLLLLLHLVETILLPPSNDFGLSQTNAGVSLEHLLGDDTAT